MERDQIIINQLINQFNNLVSKSIPLFDLLGTQFSDMQVAPNRNPVHYIIGHLVMASDQMIEALEFSKRLYPDLDIFFSNPYNENVQYPTFEELRENWIEVNAYLSDQFNNMDVNNWLSRHHYVSPDDFVKEPERNKLTILITRYAHLSGHLSQLRLIKIENK